MEVRKLPFLYRIKESVKRILKSNGKCQWGYDLLHAVWRSYRISHARSDMRKHGVEIMNRLHATMHKFSIPYYCDAGNLLGFIRDGDFIKGDADFDISILPEYGSLANALRLLSGEGYIPVYAYDYNGRMIEFTVMDPIANINIDVFQSEYESGGRSRLTVRYLRWYADRSYPSEKDNTALEFSFRAPQGIKTIRVNGMEVDVPVNAEEILDDEYGNWRVYDPTFKSDKLPHVEGKSFAHRLTIEEALAHP